MKFAESLGANVVEIFTGSNYQNIVVLSRKDGNHSKQ